MHDANHDPAAAATATAPHRRASGHTGDCTPEQGHVVWHELRSADPLRARDFYARLLGWTVRPAWAHPADRAVLHLDGVGVAEVGPLDPADGDDSHWLPMIATADVEGCCARAPELRGSVYPPPEGRRGLAVLEDPQGAVWGALDVGSPVGPRSAWHHRPASHQPTIYRPGGHRRPAYRPMGYPAAGHRAAAVREEAQPGQEALREERTAPPAAGGWSPESALPPLPPPPPPGSIAHALLLTPDALDAREFYGSLLGWRFHQAGQRLDGGDLLGDAWIARMGAFEQATVVASTPAVRARLPRPTWLPCVTVASLDGSLEAAWALGAAVILGEVLLPSLGRLGVVRDPTGAVLALLEPVAPR